MNYHASEALQTLEIFLKFLQFDVNNNVVVTCFQFDVNNNESELSGSTVLCRDPSTPHLDGRVKPIVDGQNYDWTGEDINKRFSKITDIVSYDVKICVTRVLVVYFRL